MNSNVLEALDYLDPVSLSYDEWLSIGIALKNEGYSVSVWDEWSKKDSKRYKGDCEKKWETFEGSIASPLSGGTIIHLAQIKGGYTSISKSPFLEWNDVIEYDGDGNSYELSTGLSPSEQLITYLNILFQDDEFVGYVTSDVYKTDEGRYVPNKGFYDRTKKELVDALLTHKDDIGAVLGDSKPEAGAWIRFNPVDGKGVKNENVTRFTYALVESDEMSIEEQDALYRKLQLPIACLVYSGSKSLHAIVKVDAKDAEDYRKRVTYLYSFLEKNGLKIDSANRNPSRLSRMPGVIRDGEMQSLIATNIGCRNYEEWVDFAEGFNDSLPKLTYLDEQLEHLPELPEELIGGILRKGHKMLIAGSSKAGKSFLLMELCVALSEGINWLKFPCKKTKVLYVNLEIDPSSCVHRFNEIYKALKIKSKHSNDIVIWNLRGHAVPLNLLVPILVRRIKDQGYGAVILDPIYKVITGDENNASEMGAFCNCFDKICAETGCSAIYCHHHSKGSQTMKNVNDRASGSGVFARDPDAILDMTQIKLDPAFVLANGESQYSTAWKVEGSLREFPTFMPFDIWFNYPVHAVDTKGLIEAFVNAPLVVGEKDEEEVKPAKLKETDLDFGFGVSTLDGVSATLEDVSCALGVSDRTVRRLVEKSKSYAVDSGKIVRSDKNENQ